MRDNDTLSLSSDSGSLLRVQNGALSRFASEFLHSFAYSAVQSPINGVAQIMDSVSGKEVSKSVQLIDAPVQTNSGSVEWHAQTLGGAAGLAADFLLLRKLCGRPSAELPRSTMIQRSALTGAVLNGVFRPSDPEQDLLTSRFRAAGIGALSFAAMSALHKPVEGTLRVRGVNSPLLSGIVTGAPIGTLEAVLNNATGGKHQNILETAYASALTGGVLGRFNAFAQDVRQFKPEVAAPSQSTASNTFATPKVADARLARSSSAQSQAITATVDGANISRQASQVTVRQFGPGDTTPVMQIAQMYSLPPRVDTSSLVLVVNGKVRGYANFSDVHNSIGEIAVLPEFRGHSRTLIGAVREHAVSMGGAWKTMARVSTSGALVEAMNKRGTIKILEKSEPFPGPTEDMFDVSFVFRAPRGPVSGLPLRRFLGIAEDTGKPVAPLEPTSRPLSERAHEQSNQWIASQMIFGKLEPGVRIAPAFGEPVSQAGPQRNARYALIGVDEARDPTLKRILQDTEIRFAGLGNDKLLQAEEIARYVRRICNPNNEGPTIEQRAEAMLIAMRGETVPLGEFIRTNSCLCVQSSLLYKKIADQHSIPTTVRSELMPFGQHAVPESLVGKKWLTFDSARSVYGEPANPGRRGRR